MLHACAREGNTPLAEIILSRKSQATADALNARAHNGGTPLHVAVAHQQPGMLTLLLAQDNLDRGVSDGEGNTAVHVACLKNNIPLLSQLLKSGRGVTARELAVVNGLGWAALHSCAFHGHAAAVRMLLTYKSSPEVRTADCTSRARRAS